MPLASAPRLHYVNRVEPVLVPTPAMALDPPTRRDADITTLAPVDGFQRVAVRRPRPRLDLHERDRPASLRDQVDLPPPEAPVALQDGPAVAFQEVRSEALRASAELVMARHAGSITGKRGGGMAEQGRILDSDEEIADVLRRSKRLAILGIKPETHAAAPAHYVPAYLQRAGYEIVPVPVYYPDVTEILGNPVHRSLEEVPGDIDLVVVFRRSRDVAAHVDDILAKHPDAVWMQLGIRNDEAAERLTAAGIDVVQDRCAMVEHRSV